MVKYCELQVVVLTGEPTHVSVILSKHETTQFWSTFMVIILKDLSTDFRLSSLLFRMARSFHDRCSRLMRIGNFVSSFNNEIIIMRYFS